MIFAVDLTVAVALADAVLAEEEMKLNIQQKIELAVSNHDLEDQIFYLMSTNIFCFTVELLPWFLLVLDGLERILPKRPLF